MTNELLELVPDHERAVGNKVYYEKELEKEAQQKAFRGDDGSEDVPVDTTTVSQVANRLMQCGITNYLQFEYRSSCEAYCREFGNFD